MEFDDGLKKTITDLARSGARIERELGRPIEIDGDGTHDGDYVLQAPGGAITMTHPDGRPAHR